VLLIPITTLFFSTRNHGRQRDSAFACKATVNCNMGGWTLVARWVCFPITSFHDLCCPHTVRICLWNPVEPVPLNSECITNNLDISGTHPCLDINPGLIIPHVQEVLQVSSWLCLGAFGWKEPVKEATSSSLTTTPVATTFATPVVNSMTENTKNTLIICSRPSEFGSRPWAKIRLISASGRIGPGSQNIYCLIRQLGVQAQFVE
jgi:hypothetical protein